MAPRKRIATPKKYIATPKKRITLKKGRTFSLSTSKGGKKRKPSMSNPIVKSLNEDKLATISDNIDNNLSNNIDNNISNNISDNETNIKEDNIIEVSIKVKETI